VHIFLRLAIGGIDFCRLQDIKKGSRIPSLKKNMVPSATVGRRIACRNSWRSKDIQLEPHHPSCR
jgi:hypothetical protein